MVDELLVFGSMGCLGWDETREVLDELEADPDFTPSISRLDPKDHQEEFRNFGLVICPSIVYKEEIIAVGPPSLEAVKAKVDELS